MPNTQIKLMHFKNNQGRNITAFNRKNQNGDMAARIQGQTMNGKHYAIKQTIMDNNKISENVFSLTDSEVMKILTGNSSFNPYKTLPTTSTDKLITKKKKSTTALKKKKSTTVLKKKKSTTALKKKKSTTALKKKKSTTALKKKKSTTVLKKKKLLKKKIL